MIEETSKKTIISYLEEILAEIKKLNENIQRLNETLAEALAQRQHGEKLGLTEIVRIALERSEAVDRRSGRKMKRASGVIIKRDNNDVVAAALKYSRKANAYFYHKDYVVTLPADSIDSELDSMLKTPLIVELDTNRVKRVKREKRGRSDGFVFVET